MPRVRDAVSNRESARRFYAANKKDILLRRMLGRVATGTVPQLLKLQEYDLSEADINTARETAGLPKVAFGVFPLRPRGGAQIPTPIAASRAALPVAPSGPAATADSPGEELDLKEIVRRLTALDGVANKLSRSGVDTGEKLASQALIKIAAGLDRVARQSGIENDIIAGLRNYPHTIDAISKRANNVNTLKTNLNFIVASAKYLPELQQAIGPDAMAAYRGDMVAGIQASKKEEVLRTESEEHRIPSISAIRAKLPLLRQKYGFESPEYIGALLQTSIVGLRDNLGAVKLTKSDVAEPPNYYNRNTGHLVIRDFKTQGQFPPYDEVLSDDLRRAIESSVAERKRTYLIGQRAGKLGPVLSKAFKSVGLKAGVMTIRHAMSSDMMSAGGAGAANIQRVSKAFKHSADMATRYMRLIAPDNYDDDAEGVAALTKKMGELGVGPSRSAAAPKRKRASPPAAAETPSAPAAPVARRTRSSSKRV
jgi:hypothetical protein